VHTDHGSVRLDGPRDRDGTFEPQIVKKGQRRFDGFDEKIVALYARGLSVRDIQAHLAEIYGVEVGHDLISRVTDAVLEDVKAWQARPLEEIYPIVFLDALVVKIRDHGVVPNKHAYLAIGVNGDGEREVLGIWIEQTEGAKFWLQVLTELKQRGVADVLVCCVDGLKGFPEAIETVWPGAVIQTEGVDQCVASLGFSSSVLTMTRSTSSSLIDRGLPGRGSSCSPSRPRRANRPRHLPTVDLVQPRTAAMSLLCCPSAAANTIRQRNANACELFGRRAHRSSTSRSSPLRTISAR
jgi:hypothetical protein